MCDQDKEGTYYYVKYYSKPGYDAPCLVPWTKRQLLKWGCVDPKELEKASGSLSKKELKLLKR